MRVLSAQRRGTDQSDLAVPRGTPLMGARYDADAFGRMSETIARFLGTGRLLVGQTVIVIGWIVLNAVGFIRAWDPYPFILLNLAFSLQAAYAAPLTCWRRTGRTTGTGRPSSETGRSPRGSSRTPSSWPGSWPASGWRSPTWSPPRTCLTGLSESRS
jgi:hypothetical protein